MGFTQKITIAASLLYLLGSPAQADELRLKIGAFSEGVISSKEISRIESEINRILMGNSHLDCQNTKVRVIEGPTVFSDGTPSFVGDGNFSKFKSSGFSINIVSQILECGGKVNPSGSFGGCTTIGGFPIVVVLGVKSVRPVVWLHEIGHAQGLRDRCDDRKNGCPKYKGWLMRGVAEKVNTKISEDECATIAGEQNFPIIDEHSASSDQTRGNLLDEASSVQAIEDLLHEDWHHAMPVTQLFNLVGDSDSIQELSQILNSSSSELMPNAVLAMGIIGSQENLEDISNVLSKATINKETEEIIFETINAKLNVPIAIGYLASRRETNPETLLNFLSPKNSSSYFDDLPSFKMVEEYAKAFSRNAVVGAALSGSNERAASVIEEARHANRAGAYDLGVEEEFFERVNALSNNIAKQGLRNILAQEY